MFHIFIKDGQYCIREVGKKDFDAYDDYRLFASDVKVRLENEAEISKAVASAKEHTETLAILEHGERRNKPRN